MALSDKDGIVPSSTDGDATEEGMITPMMAMRGGPDGLLFQPIHESQTLAALINGNFGVASGTTLDHASNHDWEYIRGAIWKVILVVFSSMIGARTITSIRPDLNGASSTKQELGNVRIHNNSYSDVWDKKTGQLGYEDDATAVGKFVHEHQDFVVLIAARNDADKETHGESQIGDNGAAKNCITVGATGSTRSNDSFKFKPGSPKHLTPTDTARFSSRGPTKCSKNCKCEDVVGRIKPDVVAPGVVILSAGSRSTTVAFRDSKDEDWFFMSGTSMATPLVAGCVALTREALQKKGNHRPSAALIKALLVNGAINHSGPGGLVFDYEQGFGLVDVDASIDMIEKETFVDGGNKFETSKWDAPSRSNIQKEDGEWKSHEISLPGGRHRLIVTLAYPNPKHSLLQNSVKLIVRAGGEERDGKMGNDQGFDKTNYLGQCAGYNGRDCGS
ncbi:hypothetical protein CEP52_002369 [Fusarium oligoseptatum]|uniref:Peptidase S8/S53 domain-containing protein n=1 Tax=Fusarium oligoseptatum TaxID=2604345 RepID=A0A428UE93_9HYPO|nr:hypothetical protein CEP52_002369 [Fusarium oligoseptatum]